MKQFLMKLALCCGCLSFGVVSAMNADILAISSESSDISTVSSEDADILTVLSEDADIFTASSENADISTISSNQETHALQNIVDLILNKNVEEETIKEAISSYLDNGFNINARYGESRETLLHIAADNGRNEVAKFLINKGINVNITSEYIETALHIAARNGNTVLVRLLSPEQKDINMCNCEGETAIYNAAYQTWSDNIQTRKEVIQILLDNGADPTIRKWVHSFPGHSAIDTVELKKKIAKQEGKDVSRYQEIIDLMLQYVPKK